MARYGFPKPIAIPLAIEAPIIRELARPGPLVAANASIWERTIFAVLAARSTRRGATIKWLRDAISGTMPPYGSCAAICDATSLANSCSPEPSLRPRRIATAVSSHEVSRAKIVMSPIGREAWSAANGGGLLFNRLRFGRVFLRVNHHALEGVDGPQHLRIFGLDARCFVFGLYILSVPQGKQRAFLFHGHGDGNVRRDAIALDDLFTRRVVLGSGKTHRGTVGQLHDVLHGAFPKGGLAYQDGTTQILERSGHNLRAAGAAFINENDHGEIGTLLFCRRGKVIALLGRHAPLSGYDLCVGRQKFAAHVHGAVQQAAGIISKVQNQRLHPLLL